MALAILLIGGAHLALYLGDQTAAQPDQAVRVGSVQDELGPDANLDALVRLALRKAGK